METEEEDGGEERQGGGGISPELVASYVAFAKRALRQRWYLTVAVLLVGITLTVVAFKFLPRTFTCTTVLMTQGTLLDGQGGAGTPLSGAESLIMRHENLEKIIKDDGLISKFESRRPPLLKLKDKVSKSLFGEMSDKIKLASLVGTLEVKMTATVEKGVLTIKTDWTDPVTASELTELARQSFVQFRHTAEMSAFEEKMTILDQHAATLRTEIGQFASQVKAMHEEDNERRREEALARKEKYKEEAAADKPKRTYTRAPIRADAQLPELVERLNTLKRKLSDVETERDRRMREEEAKLADMRLKLTPSHPLVITQEERLAAASEVPSSLALMRSEAKDLQAEIDQRRGIEKSERGTSGLLGSNANEPLPSEIVQLLDRDDTDPALTAQLSSAVLKFTRLRDDMTTSRVELDLAQAAFNHRYQIVVPAEVPTKPTKPKPVVIIAAGLVLSLLISLIVPILLELKRGVITETWQVHNLQLPVLAVLRLPPYSSD